jgi:hypothetical protein
MILYPAAFFPVLLPCPVMDPVAVDQDQACNNRILLIIFACRTAQ